MAGPLLGFGCAVLVSTNAAPWYQENAPGLIRTVGAIFFPIGIISYTHPKPQITLLTASRSSHDRTQWCRPLH